MGRDDVLRWARNYLEETGEAPTVRAIIGEFGLTTEKFYELFRGGIAELCESIDFKLPEERVKRVPPPTPPADLRAEFERLVKTHELECDKQAFKTALELYTSEVGELGEAGKELAIKFGLLGKLTEGVQDSSGLTECGALLDELVLKLQEVRERKKLKEDAEAELLNLEQWQEHFESQGGAGRAWDRKSESVKALLSYIIVQSGSEDLPTLKELFDDATRNTTKLIREGKRLVGLKKWREKRAKWKAIIRQSPRLIESYLGGMKVPAEFLKCVAVDNQIDARRVARVISLYWLGKRDLRGEERREAVQWFVDRARRDGLNFVRCLEGFQRLQQAAPAAPLLSYLDLQR